MIICSPQLGISPQSILGGEIYDREILYEFARMGHQVEVILPYGRPYKSHPNLRVTYIPIPFVVPPHLYNALALPYIIYLYRKYKFDILRIHSPTYIGVAAWMFKKIFPQVPIVGVYHWLGEGGWAGKWLDPHLIRMFDVVITDSGHTKMQIESRFPHSFDKVYAVHNGIDRSLTVLKPKPVLHLSDNKSTIILLFMGLFEKRKNPLFLLPIVKKLKLRGLDVLMLFCGKGPLEEKIALQAEKLGIQKSVKIIKPVFGKEKNELLNASHIFVHPSHNEGFSLAVIEAMAVGLPVVMRDAFSAREAVTDGKHGFLCTNEEDWVKKLEILCENISLRDAISVNCLRKVEKDFQWHIAAKKQLKILNALN